MKYFAQLIDNKVVSILKINDDSDENCIEYIKSICGENTFWRKINPNILENNESIIEYVYDETLDTFLPPPVEENNSIWEPPIPRPELTGEEEDLGYFYEWDQEIYEETGDGWVLHQI